MMKTRTLLFLPLIGLMFTLGGCFVARTATNDPLDAEAINTLQPGTTTAREVVELLGAPTDVVQLGRRTAYRYDAVTEKSFGLILLVFNAIGHDQRSDRLWVFFDERDVLSHYGASYGTHRTQYAMPWEAVHEPSDNASRDANRPGVER